MSAKAVNLFDYRVWSGQAILNKEYLICNKVWPLAAFNQSVGKFCDGVFHSQNVFLP